MAAKGQPKTGGRQKGTPNKITGDVKTMVLEALQRAGGTEYLLAQAHDNPKAFLSLLGRILPMQVTGKDGDPLIPVETDPSKIALAILNVIEGAKPKE